MSENVGVSTSRNPKGLHGLYKENFTFSTAAVSETRVAGERHMFQSGWTENSLFIKGVAVCIIMMKTLMF
jgi:hypothetical protein